MNPPNEREALIEALRRYGHEPDELKVLYPKDEELKELLELHRTENKMRDPSLEAEMQDDPTQYTQLELEGMKQLGAQFVNRRQEVDALKNEMYKNLVAPEPAKQEHIASLAEVKEMMRRVNAELMGNTEEEEE